MDVNFYSLFSLVTIIISTIIFLYVVYLQYQETYGREKDFITPLRQRILMLFILSILSSAPSIVYQYARTRGWDSEQLRNIVTISGGIFRITISWLMLMIWTFKGRPKK